MINPKWTATKKEFTFDAEGKEKPEKITYEKNQTNWLDLFIKAGGAFAIFLTLLLLYIQRQNEIDTERSKNLAELYTNISTDLQRVTDSNIDSKDFSNSYDNILFRYPPKVDLAQYEQLNVLYSKIVDYTRFHQYFSHSISLIKTIISQETLINDGFGVFVNSVNSTIKVNLKVPKTVLIGKIDKVITDINSLENHAVNYNYFINTYHQSGESSKTDLFLRDTSEQIIHTFSLKISSLRDYLKSNRNSSITKFLQLQTEEQSKGGLDKIYPHLLEQIDLNKKYLESSRKSFEKEVLKIL